MPTRNVAFPFSRRRTGHRPGDLALDLVLDSPGDWLQPTCFQEGFGPESSAATLPEKHSVGPTESHPALQWCLFQDSCDYER